MLKRGLENTKTHIGNVLRMECLHAKAMRKFVSKQSDGQREVFGFCVGFLCPTDGSFKSLFPSSLLFDGTEVPSLFPWTSLEYPS